MRISDRSSDVCSSDLLDRRLLDRLRRVEIGLARAQRDDAAAGALQLGRLGGDGDGRGRLDAVETRRDEGQDRQSVVSGKSVSVRVDLGGRRIIKKKINIYQTSPIETNSQ